jgi:hypothetical protein
VTAADPATGQAASTSISLSGGLSDEDMEKILEQDPTARVAAAATPDGSNSRTAASAPAPVAADEEIVLLEETRDEIDLDLELDDDANDGDLELISDDLSALAAESNDSAGSSVMDPNAVSISDLDGEPDELVPLGNAAVEVNVNEGNPREDLFDSSNKDLSADDDETELE